MVVGFIRVAIVAVFMMLGAGQLRAEGQGGEGGLAVSLYALFDRLILAEGDDALGELKGLAVNPETGHAPWLVVASGRNLVVIPTQALTVDKAGNFRLHMSRQDFALAPRWRLDQLAEINSPEALRRITAYYGLSIETSPAAEAAVGKGVPYRLVGTPLPGVEPEDFGRHVRILGDRLVAVQGGEIGVIRDLLLDVKKARVHYAAVDTGWEVLAIPVQHMAWQSAAGYFAINFPDRQLRTTPRADWPRDRAVLMRADG